MDTKKQYTKKHGNILRFKRWSRAKYAVFASISSCVSIGRLKASIADCLLKKQENSLSENNTIFKINDTENKDSAFSELPEQVKFSDNLNFFAFEIAVGNQPYNFSFDIFYFIQSTEPKVDAWIFPASTFFI
jgi:hypothetical protein